jgi:hypothetical protein
MRWCCVCRRRCSSPNESKPRTLPCEILALLDPAESRSEQCPTRWNREFCLFVDGKCPRACPGARPEFGDEQGRANLGGGSCFGAGGDLQVATSSQPSSSKQSCFCIAATVTCSPTAACPTTTKPALRCSSNACSASSTAPAGGRGRALTGRVARLRTARSLRSTSSNKVAPGSFRRSGCVRMPGVSRNPAFLAPGYRRRRPLFLGLRGQRWVAHHSDGKRECMSLRSHSRAVGAHADLRVVRRAPLGVRP